MTATLRTDFDSFLFAPISDDANGVRLTVLTILARQGVDPWVEAAELADLSRESATQELASMLAGVPNGPSPGADTTSLAARLVGLLHGSRRPASVAAPEDVSAPAELPRERWGLGRYALIVLGVLVVLYWVVSLSR